MTYFTENRLYWRRSVDMGLCCAIPGLVAGLFITRDAIGEGWEMFAVTAPVASFVCGAGLWRLLAARRLTAGRGALAGFLASIAAHWLCWYLMMTLHWLGYALFDAGRSSLGEPPVNPLQALYGAAVFTLISLAVCGWITGPVGAGIGLVLGWRQRRRMDFPPATAASEPPAID